MLPISNVTVEHTVGYFPRNGGLCVSSIKPTENIEVARARAAMHNETLRDLGTYVVVSRLVGEWEVAE